VLLVPLALPLPPQHRSIRTIDVAKCTARSCVKVVGRLRAVGHELVDWGEKQQQKKKHKRMHNSPRHRSKGPYPAQRHAARGAPCWWVVSEKNELGLLLRRLEAVVAREGGRSEKSRVPVSRRLRQTWFFSRAEASLFVEKVFIFGIKLRLIHTHTRTHTHARTHTHTHTHTHKRE
jgi:hypothetical protein